MADPLRGVHAIASNTTPRLPFRIHPSTHCALFKPPTSITSTKQKYQPPSPTIMMYFAYGLSLSALAVMGQLVLASRDYDPSGTTQQCSIYTLANTTAATCNDNPNVICTKGCRGFVTAEGCRRDDGSDPYQTKPTKSHVCNVGFFQNTAGAKSCQTKKRTYRCTGNSYGSATCSGCIETRIYHAPSQNYPDDWARASHANLPSRNP
ncbi:hypothetical protein PTTG_25639 [Puccinia triticina 1-1 BBBD Race 1]|uniref:Uncharacterized protein n=2 Tax=Puccinia triticina TaxID=208348 RepID=A0A180H188_PUCT1|nr:uncharacterized protein PtA15_9A409 [Puccinia triticina]OAV98379.1 hypothetical protein PTTG_25639 [Puccinia triticina 1-1 BBBD Race 1]WAQ88282.1 hypothetical protein PtA15_9A409 [Puccinia triticina]WAR60456.1 hypothetical protein PtB15_9B395 [Puccinia triticina]